MTTLSELQGSQEFKELSGADQQRVMDSLSSSGQASNEAMKGTPWSAVESSPEFTSLSFEDQNSVRGHYDMPQAEKQTRSFSEYLTDPLVAGAQGVINLGSAAVGLADLVTPGDLQGTLKEAVGYDPKESTDFLEGFLSESQKNVNRDITNAEGFGETLVEYIKNPSAIGQELMRSAPSMLGGGAVARGLPLAVKGLARAAVGEGLLSAGSAQAGYTEELGRETTLKEKAHALATGMSTFALNKFGGTLAKKFGLEDVDSLFAGLPANVSKGKVLGRMAAGGITEGSLEEMPQSVAEKVLENSVLDKPLWEGVPKAAATGLAVGGVMGSGVNLVGSGAKPVEAEAIGIAAKTEQIAKEVESTRDENGFLSTDNVVKANEIRSAGKEEVVELSIEDRALEAGKKYDALRPEVRNRDILPLPAEQAVFDEVDAINNELVEQDINDRVAGGDVTTSLGKPIEQVIAKAPAENIADVQRVARIKREGRVATEKLGIKRVPITDQGTPTAGKAETVTAPHVDAMSMAISQGGIDLNSAKQMFSHDTIASLGKKRPGLFRVNGGQQVDEAANDLGYDSSDSMIESWASAETKGKTQESAQIEEQAQFDIAKDAAREDAVKSAKLYGEFREEILREPAAVSVEEINDSPFSDSQKADLVSLRGVPKVKRVGDKPASTDVPFDVPALTEKRANIKERSFRRKLNQVLKGDNAQTSAVMSVLQARAGATGMLTGEYLNQRGMDIVPDSKQFDKGIRQANKGAVVLNEHEAVIHAFGGADGTTAIHEMGHIFRRDLDSKDNSIVEKWAGVNEGKWTTEAEEKFSRGFEKYITEGVAPTKALERVFKKLKEVMLSVYGSLSNPDIDIDISPEIRAVFDRMLGGEVSGKTEVDKKSGEFFQRDQLDNQKETDVEYGDVQTTKRKSPVSAEIPKRRVTGKALAGKDKSTKIEELEEADFYSGYSENVKGSERGQRSLPPLDVPDRGDAVPGPVADENFKDWFGESLAVTKDGKPMVWFHGSPTFGKADDPGSWSFDPERRGENVGHTFTGFGTTFTSNFSEADFSTRGKAAPLAFNIRMENPYILNDADIAKLNRYSSSDSLTAKAEAFMRRKMDLNDHDSLYNPKTGFVYLANSAQSKSLANSGAYGEVGDVLMQQAGVKSKTADTSALHDATQRLESGDSPEQIRKDTGWHLGKDKKWRYEIDDSKATFLAEFIEGRAGRLGQFLKHNDLYKAYPELRKLDVSVVNLPRGTKGRYVPNDFTGGYINIAAREKSEGQQQTLMHEIQHAVQKIEGFAAGGSVDGGEVDKYKSLHGEIEARDTAERMGMTAEERISEKPYVSQGIPMDQAIIRYSDDDSASGDDVLMQSAATPLTEEDYAQNRAESSSVKNRAIRGVKSAGREVSKGFDKYMGSISTRLGDIDPTLKADIRKLDYNIGTKQAEDVSNVIDMLNATKEMSRDDAKDWDYARKNSDTEKIDKLVGDYEFEDEYKAYRDYLDNVHKEAEAVGLDIGFVENYSPRILKDKVGFLNHIGKGNDWGRISEALRKRAEEIGIDTSKMTDEMKADIASNVMFGGMTGMGGPGHTKARRIETIPPELNKYYMDSDSALVSYIHGMRKTIEQRKFFGKVPKKISQAKTNMHRLMSELRKDGISEERKKILQDNVSMYRDVIDKFKYNRDDYNESISQYVADQVIKGNINPDQENTLTDIMQARFHEKGTRGIIQAYKNFSYIDTMGSPISALTQIGDQAFAAYEGGWVNALKNSAKAFRGKSRITKEDVGIDRMAQEFADESTLARAVNKVFKMVGLEKMDSIGKESLLNTSLEKFEKRAKDDPEKLSKEISPIFGEETQDVIEDLQEGEITENVKLLVYSRLLDFQPVALSEMPEQYLKAGNGRVFYMLKTYTLKQFDVFRREAYKKIRHGDRAEKIQGVKNMARLSMMLVLANAGADELKDLALGRKTDLDDRLVDNVLRLFGVSKFVTWQARQEGLPTALLKQILPPFKFLNALTKDIVTRGDEKGLQTASSIPVVGKIADWHMGRSSHKRADLWQRRLSKVKKKYADIKDRVERNPDEEKKYRKELRTLSRITSFQYRANKIKKEMNEAMAKGLDAKAKRIEKRRNRIIKQFIEDL